ncbi:MAG: ABC transporter substrate-binding protein [Planctomycetaceae bacterium]|nr:ABC transporter substrate-binding protein [Planctomycetaceae bacterium]
MKLKQKIVAAMAVVVLCLSGIASAVELKLYCNPIEEPYLRECLKDWEAQTGHSVTFMAATDSSTDTLALYQQQLAAGAHEIDVYQVDSIWPGMLANHLLDLLPYSADREKLHLPSVIDSNTVKGRLVSMPLFVDAGMMLYRKDLLEKYDVPVPVTWGELRDAARTVMDREREAGNPKMWGLVFQGRAYEGLTCCALEWIDSYGGGLIDADGKIIINSEQATAALAEAASWVGTITPEGVLNYAEEEARGVFQSGDSVFMRNWPYAWALGQEDNSPIKGKIGIMPVPKGSVDGKTSGCLGSWGLAVNKYSKNHEAAADLVFYLTGPVGQKKFCLMTSHIPSVISLFEDEEMKNANPVVILDLFMNTIPRPAGITGTKYNRVSNEFYNAVHAILSKGGEPAAELQKLENTLRRVSWGGWN